MIEEYLQISRKNYTHDFIIHDTDKASMNIRVSIPDTRLDSLFGVMPDLGKDSVRD